MHDVSYLDRKVYLREATCCNLVGWSNYIRVSGCLYCCIISFYTKHAILHFATLNFKQNLQ